MYSYAACITFMARTSISVDSRTAACLRYLAAQERRSASNLVACLIWDKFKVWVDHWKAEEVQQLLESFDLFESGVETP